MAARIKPAGQTQAERDRISLGRIESLIDNAIDGKAKCPSCQAKFEIKDIPNNVATLMKMRYDKLRPSLSAVEQTNLNPEDSLSEDQIINKLQALIAGNRELVSKLLADHAKAQPGLQECGVNTESAVQQPIVEQMDQKQAS